jgi:hypothetical protein
MPSPYLHLNTRMERWVPAFLGCALLLLALGNGLRATWGAEWPWMYDALRDVGMAQVMLEGRYPADNLYPQETLWINPLTAAVIAVGALVSGAEAPTVSAQLGPFVNLLPAIALALLAAWWRGRWAAVAALAGYLLWNAQEPSYAYATYTPWLFASHLAQGFFCLSLLAYNIARQRGGWGWFAIAGFLHGLTFLTHTGPAVLLGCIFVAMSVTERGNRGRGAAQLAVVLGSAFVVSLPYTWPIIARYQMQMVNLFPAANAQSPMRLDEIGATIWGAISVGNALAVAGLAQLVIREPDKNKRRLAWVWLTVLAGWTVQVYAWQWMNMTAWGIPQVVPAHHFHAAFTLFRALCLGAGVMALCDWVMQRLGKAEAGAHGWAAAVAVLLVALAALPGYVAWQEFRLGPRERAEYRNLWEQRNAMAPWLRDNIQPGAAILCDDQVALVFAAPVARGAVSTMLIFSSPYIKATKRLADRDRLYDALRAKDFEAFTALARAYNVRLILVKDNEDEVVRAAMGAGAPIQAVDWEGPLRAYTVDLPAQ